MPMPEGLGLVRTGDDAAVVVREHYDGASHQIGPENPFAGGVEVVAVAEPVHGCLFEGFDDVADDAPDLEIISASTRIGRYFGFEGMSHAHPFRDARA